MCEIYYSTQSLRTVNNSLIGILKRCSLVLDARVCGVMLKKRALCFRTSPMKLGYYAKNYAPLEV